MFLIQGRNQENFEQGRIQLFLKPKEALYVPFTYQTFSSGIDRQEIDTQGGISSNTNKSLLLEAKTIRAVIKRADNSDLLSVLLLQVEPHPHTVHQVFRFYHEENSFMTKMIRLSTDSGIRAKVRFVKSTDPTVIAEIRNSPDGYTQDLFIKAGCSRSPLVRSFFVLLYADSFLSAPVNIWQF
uniref:Uncharacterized protein n=1 Tax=Plectus sambesii TaxID=2011161 RepID=A0A914UUS9_9BILA